jgi:hypothetical protein
MEEVSRIYGAPDDSASTRAKRAIDKPSGTPHGIVPGRASFVTCVTPHYRPGLKSRGALRPLGTTAPKSRWPTLRTKGTRRLSLGSHNPTLETRFSTNGCISGSARNCMPPWTNDLPFRGPTFSKTAPERLLQSSSFGAVAATLPSSCTATRRLSTHSMVKAHFKWWMRLGMLTFARLRPSRTLPQTSLRRR